MSGPSLKLPRGADELLRDLPIAEPDFEAQAQAIEARLQARPSSADAGDVLGVPELAPEPGEPGRAVTPPSRSLAEMARRSVQQPSDDSTALVKELLAATSRARRPDAEMVARVRAAGKTPATSTPLASNVTPLPGGERPSGVVSRVGPAVSPVQAAPRSKRGALLGAAAAALALAAGLALFVSSGRPSAEPPAATAAVAATPEPAGEPHGAPPSAAAAAAPQARSSGDGVLTPDALAMAPEPKGREPSSKAAALAAAPKPHTAVAAPGASPHASAATTVDAPAEVAHAEMRPEPASEPVLKPAQGSTDSLPLSPSGGAVSTALGAVRADAQACLAGQNGAVAAVVTFASDGHVTHVKAGGPSGACIQAALSKARISPFAKDQFSATTTIRPP